MINDAHVHFFSSRFFAALARQRRATAVPADLTRELGWDDPGSEEALADRWVQELDRHGVARAALIGSLPGEEVSAAAAVARHPSRFVGFFMLDASAADAAERTRRAITELGMRCICLFPAMHHVRADDDRMIGIAEIAAAHPGTTVFVHCGVLSIGVRRKLGLPSRFDMRLGDPLALCTLALACPAVPFIVPHFGAGLLREALMLADTCPNVHFDTSSSNSWIRYTPGLTLEAVFRATLSVAGASRLVFGTDSSFFPRGWQRPIYEQQRAIAETVGISDADAALIFGGNFDRLFPVSRQQAAGSGQ
ncbi:MAG TPA: amidohydrolase family protein [Vicinamibacterales bacterium]